MLSLTQRQEDTVEVEDNNWVRRICKVKREDRRKMGELKDEIRIKKHLKIKVVVEQIAMGKTHAENE